MKNPLEFFYSTWQVIASAAQPENAAPPMGFIVSLQSLEDRVLYDASPLGAYATDIGEVINTLEDIDQQIGELSDYENVEFDTTYKDPANSIVDLNLHADGVDSSFQTARQLIVIDGRIGSIEELVADLAEQGESGVDFDVVRLDESSDGIQKITGLLDGGRKYDAIHVIGHGSDANIQLGGTELNSDNIDAYRQQLSSWTSGLALGADILLYGCDVANTSDGELFVEKFHSFVGADVAASNDLTGNGSLGGDWDFEFIVGQIETDVVFSETVQANYQGVFATITVDIFDDVVNGTTTSIAGLLASDGGDGISLREAVMAANNTAGDDTIILGAGTYVLNIAGVTDSTAAAGDLDITTGITITGSGARDTTIDAAALGDRIFDITAGGVLTLEDLTVANAGITNATGGAVNNAGTLTATNVVFVGNSVTNNSGGSIWTSGIASLTNVSIINGSASSGGGIAVDSGVTTLTNVTVSGNTSNFDGAGISIFGGTLNIDHSTIAANSTTDSGNGGGLYNGGGTVNLSNSIVADNSSQFGGSDVQGLIVSGGFNIIEDSSGFTGSVGTDILGSDPGIDGPQLINGTYVHTFTSSSIAYNAANTAGSPATDQRGGVRDANPDIGAYEFTGENPSDLATRSTFGGGLSINDDGGDDAYLLADDGSAILGGQDQLSFEVEFSTTQNTGETTLVSYATAGGSNEVALIFNNTGLQIYIGSISNVSIPSTTFDFSSLRDGSTNTVGFTWDGSTGANGAWALYVNGVSVDSGTGLATDYTTATGGALLFGQEQDSIEGGFNALQVFKGTLYNARLFDDIRTATEMAASYRSELPFDENGMIANWKFDQLSSDGVVLEAVSGNNLMVKHTSESGFTQSEATLTLSLDENALDGTLVGQVSGLDAEREALIASLLAADTDLVYSAETNKFYKLVNTLQTWSVANSSASSELLNSIGGELVTIHSEHENSIVHSMAQGVGDVYIGATDSDVEGEFNWYSDGTNAGERFWNGGSSGYTPGGVFSNFHPSEPQNSPSDRDYVELDSATGKWYVETSAAAERSVVQWNADTVLDATQALTYTINAQTVTGAFAIDASTGTVTVAEGSLLDYETNATHTLTIQTTDVDDNTYDEAFTVSLNDLAESNSVPTDLSSGIELNSDGGNDSYLVADNGGTILGTRTSVTVETTFSSNDLTGYPSLISYSAVDAGGNDLKLQAFHEDSLAGSTRLSINGFNADSTAIDLNALFDGNPHHLAASWDSTNGDWAIYLDGQLADSGTGLATGATIAGGGTLVFGQEQDSNGGGFQTAETFQGTLYDVRIWNEVRTQAEIELNYQNKFDSGSLPTGLIANWQLDGFDGSNEVVDVVSGNNLSIGHATGTGFSVSTPVEDLHISENATNGTSVGFVVPSVPDTPQDIASDGFFNEAPAPGSFTNYSAGSSFGDWTVRTGNVDLVGTYFDPPASVDRAVELHGLNSSGGIYQTLTTEVGKQYQVIFSFAGHWGIGGEVVQDMRVSAAGESQDFSVTQQPNWSTTNMLWQDRSFVFTADSTSVDLDFQSLDVASDRGPAIANVRVVEIPQAVSTILNNDPTLSYDAATSKFYRLPSTQATFNDALTATTSDMLNGVSGEMVTIQSAYENELIRQFALQGSAPIWLGINDTSVEGT
ncbi:MAG: DUF4347 domain-containing protein, partial [Mariniblastus sp.]